MVLDREMETYRRELPRLLADEGKYVLIHGDDVAGIFATDEEAVEAGDERFGLEPFLVHRIARVEVPGVVPFVVSPRCQS